MSFVEIWLGVGAALSPVLIMLALLLVAGWVFRAHLGEIGKLYGSGAGIVGLTTLLFWVLVSFLADGVAPFDPLEQFAAAKRAPPGFVAADDGRVFLFGADNLGRDLFSRMIYGARFVLIIAPAATLIAYMVAISLALPAAYFGGTVDTVPMFVANLVLAFPVILLFYLLVTPGIRDTNVPTAMAAVLFAIPIIFSIFAIYTRLAARPALCWPMIGACLLLSAWFYSGLVFNRDPLGLIALDPNELNIFVAVVFYSSPAIFRIVRSLALEVKTRDYIAAAQTRNESAWFIMLWEILPNVRGPLIVDACLRVGYTTILLGTLGFFGLGLSPESPDWGSMIDQSRRFIRLMPTMVLPPAIALASLVLGLNLLADGLRESSLKD